ncbi:MAG: VOC family protein [Casimicrobiaceae bacterium]
MQSNPVVWFEIYVQDVQRAKAFYEAVFSITLGRLDAPDPSLEMWAFPMEQNKAGAAGALVKMPGAPSGGMGTLVYFTCDDCAVEAKKAAANGGKIFKDKFSIGQYGAIALVVDTEGNTIGLHSM